MITIDPIQVCELPISRQQVGLPEQADHDNAVLLVANEMQPAAQAIYQLMGSISEGIRITCCTAEVYAILEHMQLRWCLWPDRGFILAVLAHSQITALADRLVLSWHTAPDGYQESNRLDGKEA